MVKLHMLYYLRRRSLSLLFVLIGAFGCGDLSAIGVLLLMLGLKPWPWCGALALVALLGLKHFLLALMRGYLRRPSRRPVMSPGAICVGSAETVVSVEMYVLPRWVGEQLAPAEHFAIVFTVRYSSRQSSLTLP